MEQLAFQDSASLFSATPTTDLAQNAAYRGDRDKGKARASDVIPEETQPRDAPLAGSSSSYSRHRVYPTHQDQQAIHRIENGSRDPPTYVGRKGKAKESAGHDEFPHAFDPDSEIELQRGTSRLSLRTSRTPTCSHSFCNRHYAISSPFRLKRSIRELSSSPTSSPSQQSASLPGVGSSSSLSSSHHDVHGPGASRPTSSSSTATDTICTHSTNVHKKPRSRSAIDDLERDGQFSSQGSGELTSRAGSQGAATRPSGSSASLRPGSRGSLRRSFARRASLLVNSSTSTGNVRAFDHTIDLCDSPEPFEPQQRFEPTTSAQASQALSVSGELRAHRPVGSIRRRRGYNSRDNEPARPSTVDEPISSLDAPASAPSDTFMTDFARAVDLRLAGRTESMQNGDSTLGSALAFTTERSQQLPDVPTQRYAPQLPYVRAASPLEVSFTHGDRDQPTPAATGLNSHGHLRRRAWVHQPEQTQSDRSEAPAHAISNTSTARLDLDDREGTSPYLTPQTDAFRLNQSDRLASFRTDLRIVSERWEALAALQTRTAADPAFNRARVDYTGYMTHPQASPALSHDASNGPPLIRRRAPQEGSTNQLVTEQPSLGQQRNASSVPLRPLRLGTDHGFNTESARTIDQGRLLQQQSSRRDDVYTSLRHTDVPQHEPVSVPRRRAHFGVRAPTQQSARQDAPPASQARFEPFAENHVGSTRGHSVGYTGARPSVSASLRRERNEDESALEYLGRLMNNDSLLDGWMSAGVPEPFLRMAIESGPTATSTNNTSVRHPFGMFPPAPSTSNTMFSHGGPHLAFDARNFIADEDWAELNSYEGLMQLSERLGAAEVCVPQSLIDTLPMCEYGSWDGGSCRQLRDGATPPVVGKGKGKQKVIVGSTARDTMCPICREDYADPDILMSINKCHHAFHADCIKTWFKTAKTCPLCRADAFDEISLPALPFQQPSSSTAASNVRGGGSLYEGRPSWTFDL